MITANNKNANVRLNVDDHHDPRDNARITTSNYSNKSFTLAHISDPHLSRRYYREHIKSFKILLRTILDDGCDHIVITGDIVSTADPNDYSLAREIFSTFGLLDESRLTIIPGNHDVFGGPHRAVDVLSFPKYIRCVDYTRMLALFEEAFVETFVGVRRFSNHHLFPFIKTVGPYSIMGLNSILPWSLRKNPLGSNGMLNDEHISALSALVGNHEFKKHTPIVAMHHHFNELNDDTHNSTIWKKIEARTMRMKRRRKVIRLFNDIGVQIVLHGHIHRNEIYESNGIRFANGAGAVCDDPHRFLKYNRLQYADGASNLEINNLPIEYQSHSSTKSFHQFRSIAAVPHLEGV